MRDILYVAAATECALSRSDRDAASVCIRVDEPDTAAAAEMRLALCYSWCGGHEGVGQRDNEWSSSGTS